VIDDILRDLEISATSLPEKEEENRFQEFQVVGDAAPSQVCRSHVPYIKESRITYE